jgi:hypothetical protein
MHTDAPSTVARTIDSRPSTLTRIVVHLAIALVVVRESTTPELKAALGSSCLLASSASTTAASRRTSRTLAHTLRGDPGDRVSSCEHHASAVSRSWMMRTGFTGLLQEGRETQVEGEQGDNGPTKD